MCTAKNPAGEAVHYFDVIVEGKSTSGPNDIPYARLSEAFVCASEGKAADTGRAVVLSKST